MTSEERLSYNEHITWLLDQIRANNEPQHFYNVYMAVYKKNIDTDIEQYFTPRFKGLLRNTKRNMLTQ